MLEEKCRKKNSMLSLCVVMVLHGVQARWNRQHGLFHMLASACGIFLEWHNTYVVHVYYALLLLLPLPLPLPLP